MLSPTTITSGDLSSDRRDKCTPRIDGPGKIGKRDVLDDLEQAVVVP